MQLTAIAGDRAIWPALRDTLEGRPAAEHESITAAAAAGHLPAGALVIVDVAALLAHPQPVDLFRDNTGVLVYRTGCEFSPQVFVTMGLAGIAYLTRVGGNGRGENLITELADAAGGAR